MEAALDGLASPSPSDHSLGQVEMCRAVAEDGGDPALDPVMEAHCPGDEAAVPYWLQGEDYSPSLMGEPLQPSDAERSLLQPLAPEPQVGLCHLFPKL